MDDIELRSLIRKEYRLSSDRKLSFDVRHRMKPLTLTSVKSCLYSFDNKLVNLAERQVTLATLVNAFCVSC